jgi:4-amino-4-deoxy-L-arabinose transferase-like glycosyltransferase
MTTTDTCQNPDSPPTTESSGGNWREWRDISRHSTRNPPLNWERPALLALLGGTALLYLWGLGAAGYANEFYAAAVQAGTKSWKAFFFGSFDSSNFITVDKPPLSLWPMELSGRIFGFGSWSMLVPQALEGVASVWLLYAAVRRWFGPAAGLLAGALLAITPVAVLMFRYNQPDAAMVLLVVAAAYCATRAVESASTRWLLGTGTLVGLSFLAKGLQPFTVVPGLALAYLLCAPTSLRRRVGQLLGAGVAVVLAAGWWVLAVDLTPASARPYIGGSGDNTALGLAFGYNGLSRITGSNGPGGANFSGAPGIGRLFNALDGGQIAWLLPTSLVALAATAYAARRSARTDLLRAALMMWGGWLLVTGAVLSFAGGIIHTYYTVELAPAIAALVAIGAVVLWRARETVFARGAIVAGLAVTGVWTYTLLHRTPSWHPWVATLALAAAAAAVGCVLARRMLMVAALSGLAVLGAGSAAYAVSTAATPHTGSVPSAGPVVASAGFGAGPGPRAGRDGGPGPVPGGFPGPARGGAGFPGGPNGASGGPPARGGTPGAAGATNSALTALLKATSTKWAAATIGSQSAAPLELASGKAVMAIGGFSGNDPTPTLAQFEQYVAKGEIRYFVAGAGGGGGGGGRGPGGGPGGGRGPGGGPGGSGTGAQITAWVESHYTATTVGGVSVYDLSKPTS